MEKFTKWEDKSCGINPYVPESRKPSGVVGGLIGVVFVILRLPIVVLVLFPLLIVASFVEQVLGGLARLLLVRPICRLLLWFLGFWYIEENLPDVRRLRLGKLSKNGQRSSETARNSFGATVQSGDLILFNYTSIVEILYLYYRFGAQFALVTLPDGNAMTLTGFLGALKRAAWNGVDPKQAPSNNGTIKSLGGLSKSSRPVAIVAEGIRTNGKALLQFAPVVSKELEEIKTATRIHLIGFSYGYESFSPCNPVRDFFGYLFWLCFHAKTSMSVNLVPYDLYTAEKELRSSGDESKKTELPNLHNLLAHSIGNRGVKPVNLGIEPYFEFREYYEENHIKAKKQL